MVDLRQLSHQLKQIRITVHHTGASQGPFGVAQLAKAPAVATGGH